MWNKYYESATLYIYVNYNNLHKIMIYMKLINFSWIIIIIIIIIFTRCFHVMFYVILNLAWKYERILHVNDNNVFPYKLMTQL